MQRRTLAALAAAALLGLSTTAVVAQTYPDRPIRMLVPYAAGGGTDTVTRIVMKKVGEQLGQPVVVENKPRGRRCAGVRGGGPRSVAKGTPEAIVNRLHAEITKAVQSPEVQEALKKGGFEPLVMSPSENQRALKEQAAKWGKVIRENDVRAGR